jgi:hypothetical protein
VTSSSPFTSRLPTAQHRWVGIFAGLRPVGMTGRWRGHTAVTPIPVGDSELSRNRDTTAVREGVSNVLVLGVPILCNRVGGVAASVYVMLQHDAT